jgi:serine-type D-Ala-D-Ala carboxypeptidase/endopeptidase
VLEAYVGRYELAPGIDMTITREDAHLFEQLARQQRFEIFPESEKESS